MAEPLKSAGPLLGYNNNIPYKGHVYHVQTEDSGARRPHVITHLFADGGRIVKTTKTSYAEFVDADNLSERVRSLMRDQHKRMVIALRDGQLDHLLLEGAGPEVEELPLTGVAPPRPGDGQPSEPPSIPIDLIERAASVDDDDFVLEVQELLPAGARASGSEPSPGSYSYVGRRSGGSTRPPPQSEPPPATPRRGSSGTPPTGSKIGKRAESPAARRPPMDSLAFEDRPTTPFSLSELQGGFGDRYISDRRFDEVVLAFLRREGIVDG